MLKNLVEDLPLNAVVLDYGCYNWPLYNLAAELGRNDLEHHGCDLAEFTKTPEGCFFHISNSSDYHVNSDADQFDFIAVSHVVEHVQDPLKLFESLCRVCKPGGIIYFEAPSDRSLMIKSDPNVERHTFFSFWDDPTHVKAWTPAAFYRLALSYGCDPIDVGYIGSFMDKILYPLRWLKSFALRDYDLLTEAKWRAGKWTCYAVIKKDEKVKGVPPFKYLTLKNVKGGKEQVLKAFSGE